MKANYRFWDSLWFVGVHVILYGLMIVSLLSPIEWPNNTSDPLYSNSNLRLLGVVIPVIVVNMFCTLVKLFLSGRKDRFITTETVAGKLSNFGRMLFCFSLSFIAGVSWILFVIRSERDLILYVSSTVSIG